LQRIISGTLAELKIMSFLYMKSLMTDLGSIGIVNNNGIFFLYITRSSNAFSLIPDIERSPSAFR
jgi:hypothetical protein